MIFTFQNVIFLCFIVSITSFSPCVINSGSKASYRHSKINTCLESTRLPFNLRGWSNYSSDGKSEGNVILVLAIALVLKGNFLPSELKNSYVCPTGPSAEVDIVKFKSLEPKYTCLPLQSYLYKFVTAPLVLPGDPDYDPEIIKVKMIGINNK